MIQCNATKRGNLSQNAHRSQYMCKKSNPSEQNVTTLKLDLAKSIPTLKIKPNIETLSSNPEPVTS